MLISGVVETNPDSSDGGGVGGVEASEGGVGTSEGGVGASDGAVATSEGGVGVSEGAAGTSEGLMEASEGGGSMQQDCQTADELFEIMAMSSKFDSKDEQVLTPGDLVLLYQNMDIGTQLMSNTNDFKCKTNNQFFETVVYQGEDESNSSDISGMNSREDIYNAFLINNERINLLKNPSIEKTLCQKHGYIRLKQSNLSTEYDKHFLFQNPYIKDQLKSLKSVNNEFDSSIIPTSLLDYICCKRLEDNYNFNMDNIIKYVKHIIDQLKRISSGEYLTARAKEKWRESNKADERKEIDDKTNKVLTNATSIPLHVERKVSKRVTTWDDIVHSEVDLRSLCKILEKKVIIEVPKLLSGSYKLFSKCCTDSVIIRCKKEDSTLTRDKDRCSQVDVVFQLQRSETGHLLSKISSIMILRNSPSPLLHETSYSAEMLPLPYEVEVTTDSVHISETSASPANDYTDNQIVDCTNYDVTSMSTSSYPYPSVLCSNENNECITTTENNDFIDEQSDISLQSATCQVTNYTDETVQLSEMETVAPDDLALTIQRLNLQSSLLEENEEASQTVRKNKRKSPTNVKARIKSPYENKSHIMEEKKRKRLLEIRERREHKKMILSENCKIARNKYGKVTPLSANSVTKLSITNKSFYNSIFGQTSVANFRNSRSDFSCKEPIKEVDISKDVETILDKTPFSQDSLKNEGGNNYLDETITAVMCLKMDGHNLNADASVSTSVLKENSNFDINAYDTADRYTPQQEAIGYDRFERNNEDNNNMLPYAVNIVPMNSPIQNVVKNCDNDSKNRSLECRKSIDKIYDLMKSCTKLEDESYMKHNDCDQDNSTVPGSDSGTSLKHHLTSSNPSYFSFDKINIDRQKPLRRQFGLPDTVVPKVVISAKLQGSNNEKPEKRKMFQKDGKPGVNLSNKNSLNNPLKAISHILHEFEIVQKTKLKGLDELKNKKVPPETMDMRNITRLRSSKKNIIKQEQVTLSRNRSPPLKATRNLDKEGKEQRGPLSFTPKLNMQNVARNIDKISKNNISDDEAKEARGEAVKGPSKNNLSRIHALAQPRKLYVRAHSEEFQNKYGRNLMSDRLQRLASTSPQATTEKAVPTIQNKMKYKRYGYELAPTSPNKILENPERNVSKKARSSSPAKTLSSFSNSIILNRNLESRKIIKPDVYSSESRNYKQKSPTSSAKMINSMRKSRVPLVPTDIEIESSASLSPSEEASSIGVKLHRIVNTMLSTNNDLTDLPEYPESVESMVSEQHVINNTMSIAQKQIENYENNNNVAIDLHITTPETLSTNKKVVVTHDNVPKMFVSQEIPAKSEENVINSYSSRMSIHSFHIELDSDINSSIMRVKPSLSQSFKSSKKLEDVSEIKTSDSTSKQYNNMNWPFTNFPFQVTTVGYAFPKFAMIKANSIPQVKIYADNNNSNKIHRTVQVVVNTKDKKEQSLQTNTVEETDVHNESLKQHCQSEVCQTDNCPTTTDSKNEVNDSLKTATSPSTYQENVDSASSLDILVNLLNEIQNITTCQTQMTKTNTENEFSPNDNTEKLPNGFKENTPESEKENFCSNIIPMSALDDLRHLDSRTSMYSFYVSNDGDVYEPFVRAKMRQNLHARNVSCSVSPVNVADKQVTTETSKKNINCYTDVPSQVLPLTTNESTHMSNSFIGIFSEPSSQSVLTYFDYKSIIANASISTTRKIIEIPTDIEKSLDNVQRTISNVQMIENKHVLPAIEKVMLKYNKKDEFVSKFNTKFEGDPLMKIKRDILVTLYSFLVFTVFAALSFPEFLHRGF